jgi:type 1 fimbriae regulatory protein FimB/type 1 fimbriae regulatory protein FimE
MVQAARKAGRHPVRDAAIILMMFRHGLRTAELVALRCIFSTTGDYLRRMAHQHRRMPLTLCYR